MKNRSHVLVIAGSDSSGGAGIARDLAVLSHFGVGASLAITAVTAQTHNEVVETWGEPRADGSVRPHWEVGATLGLLDLERGAKVAARYL